MTLQASKSTNVCLAVLKKMKEKKNLSKTYLDVLGLKFMLLHGHQGLIMHLSLCLVNS